MVRTVRDVHNRQSPLARYRAERLLRRGFSQLRSKVIAIVRSKLRAQGVSLDRADLEACYAQAWQGLYNTLLAGEAVDSPEAWLVLVTFRRAIDEARSLSHSQPGAGQDITAGGIEVPSFEPDLAAALDDRARLRAVFEGLRARLSSRECEAASFCYLQGLSRAEAAAQMGIGERRMRKLMEGPGGGVPGVAGKVGELLAAIQTGGWCEQQSSLMRAYAFGILDPAGERHALAVAHTRECPACRAHVAALRGLASVLPPPRLAFPFAGSGRALVRALSRRSARGGGWIPLSAKLAVTSVVLVGAGSTYLIVRPSPLRARGRVFQAAPVSSAGSPRSTSADRLKRRGGAGARPEVRSLRGRAPSGSRLRSKSRAAPGVPASAREFSPERSRGEVLPRPLPAASSSSVAGKRAGEFGIE